ncbi:MAG: glutamine-hydrolyzing carbamoyl-phosphate synthase small subunit [Nitriliruptoraceae bacterium]
MTDALFVLEDGTHARGTSIGAPGTVFGEAVFNTGMTGYQEVLTDPSYRRQIVLMTAAHIGNYGMNAADAESDAIQVSGFVVRSAARRPSSWRAEASLVDALRDEGIVSIEGIDTRRITRHLRDRGAMRAALSTEVLDVDELVAQVLDSPGMEGQELASEVSTRAAYVVPPVGERTRRIALVDHGTKRSIARCLAELGAEVHVLPGSSSADDVLGVEPDGVLLSNGPGDPSTVATGIATTRELLGRVPVFGICLGSQLLGHALGARTHKLTFGHRGINQPVLRRSDGRVEITSHNHGFAVDPTTLGEQLDEHTFDTAHGRVSVSHVNLNDGVCEGLRAHDVPAFSVQYHPEAAPGPLDARHLFADFFDLIDAGSGGTN